MRVRWLHRALQNIDDIATYIASDNPVAARVVVSRIRRRTSTLSRHPRSGRTGRVDTTRELVIAGLPYIVIYTISLDEVHILRVLHTSQQYP